MSPFVGVGIFRMSRVRLADRSQGPKVQGSQAQSFLVPSALLPGDGDGEAAVAVPVPARVQLHLAIALAEVDARHALPRPADSHGALDARDVPAEPLLVVGRLHPLRVLGGDEEEHEAGRGLEVPHVLRRLADVRVELDAAPAEGHGLEGLGILEEAELVRVGTKTFPAPAAVLLAFGGPLPGELEGCLEGVEGHVERDHDFGVLREVGWGLRADPGELVDHEALLGQALEGGLEHVLGAIEHAVDELGRRDLLHRREHGRGERGILVDEPDELGGEADLGENTVELGDLTDLQIGEVGHGYLTVAARLTFHG